MTFKVGDHVKINIPIGFYQDKNTGKIVNVSKDLIRVRMDTFGTIKLFSEEEMELIQDDS